MFTRLELIQRLINISTQDQTVIKTMESRLMRWSNSKLIDYCAGIGFNVEKIGELFIFKF